MSKQQILNEQLLSLPEVKGVESYLKEPKEGQTARKYDVIVKLESGGLLEARLEGPADLESLHDAITFFSDSGLTRISFYPEPKREVKCLEKS